MKALCFFEKLGTNYLVTWNHILEKHQVLNGIFLKWSADILVRKFTVLCSLKVTSLLQKPTTESS